MIKPLRWVMVIFTGIVLIVYMLGIWGAWQGPLILKMLCSTLFCYGVYVFFTEM